ncbi:hypothetical protein ACJJTC_006015 [Scirpophaga incertulas]
MNLKRPPILRDTLTVRTRYGWYRYNMIFLVLISTLAVLLVASYGILRRNYGYWKKRNVVHPEPTTGLGNYGEHILLRKHISQVIQDILNKYPKEPYVGAFVGTEPVLLVQDPELVKLITTKDFYYFHGRELSNFVNKENSTQNLFGDAGDRWKVTRQNLTPIFSSAKMKNMFHLIANCAAEFEKIMDTEFALSNKIEVRNLMARYTLACICSCGFGVDVNMSESYKDNPFLNIGDVIFDSSSKKAFKNNLRSIWPTLFYALRMVIVPDSVEHFFRALLTKVFEGRNYKPTTRNDFVDMLLNLKEKQQVVGDSIHNIKTKDEKKCHLPVTDNFMIAQCVVFFAAGFETSATTLSYTLFEIAKNREVQKKAQKEVDEFVAKHQNKLSYDCVTDLPFTESCIDEALRLHPVLGWITREVMEDYVLPSGLKLDKGLRVHIPVYHLHHNPDLFTDPETFRPERFSPEERDNIVPHSYIPFGDGGRLCIGMRFAKMQMLAGLVTLLKKYNVELAEGMPTKLNYEPRSGVTQPIGGINLKFTLRDSTSY